MNKLLIACTLAALLFPYAFAQSAPRGAGIIGFLGFIAYAIFVIPAVYGIAMAFFWKISRVLDFGRKRLLLGVIAPAIIFFLALIPGYLIPSLDKSPQFIQIIGAILRIALTIVLTTLTIKYLFKTNWKKAAIATVIYFVLMITITVALVIWPFLVSLNNPFVGFPLLLIFILVAWVYVTCSKQSTTEQ